MTIFLSAPQLKIYLRADSSLATGPRFVRLGDVTA
jgi:hypothetical protein